MSICVSGQAVFGCLRLPAAVFGQQGVGKGDEFTHDTRDGHFVQLAIFGQPGLERFEVRVMLDGGHSGHIEAAADTLSARLQPTKSLIYHILLL